MTDPWINLRSQAGERVELIHAPECDTETNPVWEDPQCTCEAYSFSRLLDDADALLVVARDSLKRAMSDWEDAARPTPGSAHDAVLTEVGTFDEWLEVNEPSLAALPEHLRAGGDDE